MKCREEFTEQAKKYIEMLYTQHKQDDIDAWNGLIEILFDFTTWYVNFSIQEYHPKEDNSDEQTHK